MTLEITINELAPGLNGSKGLIRSHWSTRKELLDRFQLMVRSQTKERFKTPVNVFYIRHTTILMDWDNAAASFKLIGDALVRAKVIIDDSPQYIVNFYPQQVKVKTRKEHKTVIRIEEIH